MKHVVCLYQSFSLLVWKICYVICRSESVVEKPHPYKKWVCWPKFTTFIFHLEMMAMNSSASGCQGTMTSQTLISHSNGFDTKWKCSTSIASIWVNLYNWFQISIKCVSLHLGHSSYYDICDTSDLLLYYLDVVVMKSHNALVRVSVTLM